MKLTKKFYLTISIAGLLSLAAMFFWGNQPEIITYSLLFFSLIIYLAIRFDQYKANDTPDDYFLYTREMPLKQFIPTYITSNIGLFSSIAFSAILSFYYGFHAVIWPTIAWFFGMYWFSKKIPALLPFFKKGNTLHEFLAISYAKSDNSLFQSFRVFTSIVTFLLYFASIGIEVKFAADVFAPLFGIHESLFVAIAIATVGLYCTYLSGYRGVVITEVLQFILMALMVFIVIAFSIIILLKHPNSSSIGSGFMNIPKGSTFDIFAMVALIVFYQFCVMDMWQRCIASAKTDIPDTPEVAGQESDKKLASELQKKVFKQSILPFLLFFIAFYLIGFVVRYKFPDSDTNGILTQFLSMFNDFGILGKFLKAIIVVGFAAAAVSTVDSFLIAAVQTFMYDIYGIVIKKGLTDRIPNMESKDKNKFINFSRFFVVLFGLLSIVIAFFQFGLIQFWTSMYSLMLAFFPAVYFATLKIKNRYMVNGKLVLWGVILGSSSALILGVFGTFILKETFFSNLAPFAALCISTIFLFISIRKKDDSTASTG